MLMKLKVGRFSRSGVESSLPTLLKSYSTPPSVLIRDVDWALFLPDKCSGNKARGAVISDAELVVKEKVGRTIVFINTRLRQTSLPD